MELRFGYYLGNAFLKEPDALLGSLADKVHDTTLGDEVSTYCTEFLIGLEKTDSNSLPGHYCQYMDFLIEVKRDDGDTRVPDFPATEELPWG